MNTTILAAALAVTIGQSSTQNYEEWVDVSGKYKVDAKFIAFKNNHVYLEKQNGRIIKVHPTKLSIETLDRMKENLRAEAEIRRQENAKELRYYRDMAKKRYPNGRKDVWIADRSGAIHQWRLIRGPYGPRWYYGTSQYIFSGPGF